jgi:hypothetical protein
MAAISTATLLLLFLPFLLSLAGQGNMAKMICLLTSVLSLLFSIEPGRALLPWVVGMTIALVSVWERIRQRFPV